MNMIADSLTHQARSLLGTFADGYTQRCDSPYIGELFGWQLVRCTSPGKYKITSKGKSILLSFSDRNRPFPVTRKEFPHPFEPDGTQHPELTIEHRYGLQQGDDWLPPRLKKMEIDARLARMKADWTPKRHPIYTLGYTGKKPSELKKILESLDAVLFDIRFSPRSRAPQWNKGSLQAFLGDRYFHNVAWGNENYKGGSIQIFDYKLGSKKLDEYIYKQPVVLMCACTDPAHCHRTAIAAMLRRDGYQVSEYTPTPPQPEYYQPVLF